MSADVIEAGRPVLEEVAKVVCCAGEELVAVSATMPPSLDFEAFLVFEVCAAGGGVLVVVAAATGASEVESTAQAGVDRLATGPANVGDWVV